VNEPTALDLYRTYYTVKEIHDDLREKVTNPATYGTAGEWGAVRALEQACYYLFGAAGWLVKDLTDDEREELEEALDADDRLPFDS